MKKYIIFVVVFLFIAVSVFAGEKSGNISLTEGWYVYYERGFSNEPVKFYFNNISGQTAFKIVAIVNFYDDSGNYLGRHNFGHPGPIHQYLNFQGKLPAKIKKMTAEVYNTWEYSQ